jgi:short-subunit dehydrogenase
MMTLPLNDKVILITGASSGIGAATALALARCKAKLVLGARRTDRLNAVAEQVRQLGGQAVVLKCDVAQRDNVKALIQMAVDEFSRLDVAIANAGFGLRSAVDHITEEQMNEIWRVNLMGTWYVMTEASPVMCAQKSGHIIVISSVVARRAIPQMGPYSMTKAAQLSLAEAMRLEMTGTGVYVSSVHPTTTDTEFFDQATRLSGKTVSGVGKKQSADLVAKKIVKLIQHPQPELWPCAPLRYGLAMSTAFPSLADRELRKHLSAKR